VQIDGSHRASVLLISVHRRAHTTDLPGRLTRFRSDMRIAITWNIAAPEYNQLARWQQAKK
jgi:hypothetical protein